MLIADGGCKEALLGIRTYPVAPSKLNASPTSPGAKVTPPTSVPLWPSTISFALPSPGHQAAIPGGVAVQDCGCAAGQQKRRNTTARVTRFIRSDPPDRFSGG